MRVGLRNMILIVPPVDLYVRETVRLESQVSARP